MEYLVAGISKEVQGWIICFASTNGYRHTCEVIFPDTEGGREGIVSQIQDIFQTLRSERKRVLLVHGGHINSLYHLLCQKFSFPKVVHEERLKFHKRRLGKRFASKAQLAAEAAVTGWMVEELLLETTNICTMKCLFCPQDLMTRKRQRMPKSEVFSLISDYAVNSVGSIAFHLMGEPTVNPDLGAIIKHTADLHVEHALVTNATLLTCEKANEFFQNGLMHIMISVQTFTEEQYLRYRRPLPKFTFDKVVENIKNIILAKWEKGSNVLIELHILDTSLYQPRGVMVVNANSDAREVANYWLGVIRQLAIDCGRSDLTSKMPSVYDSNIAVNSWPNAAFSILPDIKLSFKMAGHWIQDFLRDDEIVIAANSGICKFLAQSQPNIMGVLSNGDTVLCCFDYDGGTVFGNAFSSPFAKLDAKASAIRMNFVRNREIPFPVCKRCLGVRVKLLGKVKAKHRVSRVIDVTAVGFFGGTDFSQPIVANFNKIGIEIVEICSAEELRRRSIPLKKEYLSKNLELLKGVDAFLFPPDTNCDDALTVLEELFPDKFVGVVDLIALDCFNRQRIENFRATRTAPFTPVRDEAGTLSNLDKYIPLVGEFAWHSLTNDSSIDSVSADHFERVVELIDKWSDNKPRTILEIGAYAHSTGDRLQRKYGAEVTLFDLSAATLRLGRDRIGANNANVELVAGDFHQLPFSAEYFEVIYVFAALHHAQDHEQVIREIQRVLAPNGILLVFQEPFNRAACFYKFHTNRPHNFTQFEEALNAEGVLTTVSEPSPGSRDEILFGMIENQKIPLHDFINSLTQSCDPLEITPHFEGKVGELGRQWLKWGREGRATPDLSQMMQHDFCKRLDRTRLAFDRTARGLGFSLPDGNEIAELFDSIAQDIVSLPYDQASREYLLQVAQLFGGVLTFVGRKRVGGSYSLPQESGRAKYLANFPVEEGVRIAFPNDSAKLFSQEKSCIPLLSERNAIALQEFFPKPSWSFAKQDHGFEAFTLVKRCGEIKLPRVSGSLLLVLRINFILPPGSPFCLKIVHSAEEFIYSVFQKEAILYRGIVAAGMDEQKISISIEALDGFPEPNPEGGLVKVYYAGAFPL